jgi:hypothetical protein
MKKILLPLIAALHVATYAADPLDTWHKRTVSTNIGLNAITFANGRFVAVGDRYGGVLFSSTDGATWNTHPSGVNKHLSGVTYGNNTFLAIGFGGRAITSPDGTAWTPRDTGTTANFNTVRFIGGQFVAVGDSGAVYTSPDGASWTERKTPSTNYWLGVTGFNNQVVLVGWDYKSAEARYGVTSDFQSFDIGYTGYGRYLNAVLPFEGKLLAVGYAGAAQSSANGIQWNPAIDTHNSWLFDLTLAENTVVAVGERGAITTLTPGGEWTSRTSDTRESLNAVAFGLGTFVAVGEKGTVLQSDPVGTTPTGILALENPRFSNSEFNFQFNGEIGQSYSVQTTTDLKTWSPLLSVPCTASPAQCIIPNQSAGHRSYRLVKQ